MGPPELGGLKAGHARLELVKLALRFIGRERSIRCVSVSMSCSSAGPRSGGRRVAAPGALADASLVRVVDKVEVVRGAARVANSS